MDNIPILSFYSGGGFMDIGFEQAGFKIKWANEFDKDFSILHSEGIKSWRKSKGETEKSEFLNNNSIVNITSGEILNEAFNGITPSVFGIIGGPPCQDFSINGKRRGFDGERGKLTIHFFDRILELKPTFFIMENVKGLLSMKHDKQDGLSEDDVKKLDKLKKLENEKNFLLLKRKQSLNTKSVKFDNTDQKRLKISSNFQN
jgi:DNA (cytosine-5)-methyltransferase 1